MSPLIAPFQHHTGSPSECNRTRKGNKGIQIWEKENCLVHESHDRLGRKSKRISKKLLELISDYSKVAEYKDKVPKSIASLYINREQVEFEVKKNNTIYIITPK